MSLFSEFGKSSEAPLYACAGGSTLKAFRPQALARPGAEERDRRELPQYMRLIPGAGGWGKLGTGGKCDAKPIL